MNQAKKKTGGIGLWHWLGSTPSQQQQGNKRL
jgi:hypothetical protein